MFLKISRGVSTLHREWILMASEGKVRRIRRYLRGRIAMRLPPCSYFKASIIVYYKTFKNLSIFLIREQKNPMTNAERATLPRQRCSSKKSFGDDHI